MKLQTKLIRDTVKLENMVNSLQPLNVSTMGLSHANNLFRKASDLAGNLDYELVHNQVPDPDPKHQFDFNNLDTSYGIDYMGLSHLEDDLKCNDANAYKRMPKIAKALTYGLTKRFNMKLKHSVKIDL